jgi:hypothetical protein
MNLKPGDRIPMTLRMILSGGARTPPRTWPAIAGALVLAGATAAAASSVAPRIELSPAPPSNATTAVPPLPSPDLYPVQLVLDDDAAEGTVGVTQQQFAKQFLWFNRFSVTAPFHLEEVWVLFPANSGVAAGDSVEIVIFGDADADPTNGATLRDSLTTTVQVADGNTFSIYPLGTAVPFGGGDVLIGVVPRFITSGATPPAFPAAIDVTTDGARSWIAVWSGDPPAPVVLPADNQTIVIGTVLAGGGNWMIRGFGTEPSVLEIPTLGVAGLAILAMILGSASVLLVRRRKA